MAVVGDFYDGLKLGVDDSRGDRQRIAEVNSDAQVVLLYQVEAGAFECVWRDVQSEDGVAMKEVVTRQSVSFYLPHFTRRGEQVKVVSNEQLVGKLFRWYLSTVHVDGEYC